MAGTRFGGRTLARSQALQLLFQAEACGRTVADVLEGDYVLDEGPLDPYARELALGTCAMLPELDAVIALTSANWSVMRMPAVDRNLVRIALYELFEVDAVDTAVAIDECVELARAYGTDESSRFVNGLLGKVARRRDAGEDVVAIALRASAAVEEAQDVSASDATPDADELGEGAAEPSGDGATEGADAADPVLAEDGADVAELPLWARG